MSNFKQEGVGPNTVGEKAVKQELFCGGPKNKDFKAAITNMFKELKETMFKQSMKTMIDQMKNTNKDTEITK